MQDYIRSAAIITIGERVGTNKFVSTGQFPFPRVEIQNRNVRLVRTGFELLNHRRLRI